MVLNVFLTKEELVMSGAALPIVFNTWLKELPPNLNSSCERLM